MTIAERKHKSDSPSPEIEQRRAYQRDYKRMVRSGNWVPVYNQHTPYHVIYDPCDAPFSREAELSSEDVKMGLQYGSFVDGTMLKRGNKVAVVHGHVLEEVKQ